MRITAASNQPRLNGSASARASRALTPSAFARATISVDASTAQTRASARSSSACGEPARAAADLEHARAAQVAELDEPRRRAATSSRRPGAARRSGRRSGRSRPQPAPVPSSASGATSASCSGAGLRAASRRSGTAPPLTSAGSPRSGNGTSITSKSRGATVSGKTSRASRSELGAEVARRDVGQREQPHARVARELGRLARGRVAACRRRASTSSSPNDASWTSTSAPSASARTTSLGAVSPG